MKLKLHVFRINTLVGFKIIIVPDEFNLKYISILNDRISETINPTLRVSQIPHPITPNRNLPEILK